MDVIAAPRKRDCGGVTNLSLQAGANEKVASEAKVVANTMNDDASLKAALPAVLKNGADRHKSCCVKNC